LNKLIVSMTLLFLGCTMLSSFMEGEGGLVSTQLSSPISSTVTIIPVDNTSGFLTDDVVVIGDEGIAYDWIGATVFGSVANPCVRGHNDSEAKAHADNTRVYSSEFSPINTALGFNIASTTATSGAFSVIMIPYKFFTKSVPKMIMFDYSFFTGQLAYLRVFFQALGVGFAITMAFWVVNAVMGIFRP